ncbi:MAG: hypothetical protein Q8R32_01265 [bacterium]|nr:hypothetical protein [bacterium]
MRFGTFALLGALLMSAGISIPSTAAQQLPPPLGPETGDALPQTFEELRRCIGPLDAETTKQFVGVRWLCNAFELFHAAARRALESVAGLDVTGGQRGQNSLLETWRRANVPEDELQFLQQTAASSLYGWTGAPESERARSGTPGTQEEGRIASWQDFQKNVIPITENPHGREALFRLNLLARAANVQDAVSSLTSPGGTFPEFEGERAAGAVVGGAALAAANVLTTNNVASPAEKTGVLLNLLTTLPQTLALAADDPILPASRSNPSDPLPDPLHGALAQGAIQSVAFGDLTAGSAGKGVELSGLGFPPSSIPSALVSQDVLNTLSQRIANSVQNRLNSLNNALNFLGGPAASNLSNVLGPDAFNNLASNLFSGPGGTPRFPGFPPGGGPSSLANIPSRDEPRQASCASRQPTISPEGARGLAVLLGLPPTTDPANPWEIRYVEAQQTYSQRVTDPGSGETLVIGQDDFPNPTSCVWVVSHTPPGASRSAAFIEDTNRQNATRLLLGIPQ